jgi:hypothetical protein
MYHEETPKWIPFLKEIGELAMIKTPTKLQAKLQNRGIPVTYLGTSEDHNGDNFSFW